MALDVVVPSRPLSEICPDREPGYILRNDFHPDRRTWLFQKKKKIRFFLDWLPAFFFFEFLSGLVAAWDLTYQLPGVLYCVVSLCSFLSVQNNISMFLGGWWLSRCCGCLWNIRCPSLPWIWDYPRVPSLTRKSSGFVLTAAIDQSFLGLMHSLRVTSH